MTSSRTRPLILAATAALVVALVPAASASAHDGGGQRPLLNADFVASTPTDDPIFGVKAGGAPWVLRDGDVHVRADGRFSVELEGLQIPRADGTKANPIGSIVASLFCAGALAARTGPQPMSVPGGDAEFRVMLAVPSTCDMATVLISPAANTRVYIASAMAEAEQD